MISREVAFSIACQFFGKPVAVREYALSYRALCGAHELQIMKITRLHGFVYVRLWIVGKNVGYFWYDLLKKTMSRIYRED